jgi:5'-nucleotidase
VMIHQGGQQNAPFAGGYASVNGCENWSGDLGEVVDRLDSKVDVVLSAHTHQPYVCTRNGMLMTSASSFGRLITKVDLTLSGTTKDVTAKTAANELVTRDVPEDAPVKTIVDKYKTLSTPIANRVVGKLSTPPISKTTNGAGESPLGDLIADSQLDATAAVANGSSVIAFMNPGGIRADLAASGPTTGDVTYNDLFTVQPFANTLVVKTLTGTQIKALLEQQIFTPTGQRILASSAGFTYSWSASAPAGSKVSDIKLNGTPIDPATGYRVTMNSFLATGGDGFTVFNQGTDQLGGAVDIDALEAYLTAHNPYATVTPNRITNLP